MYAKLVVVDGFKIWVNCSPNTPLSEVLRKASFEMEKVEKMRLIEKVANMGRFWSSTSHDD